MKTVNDLIRELQNLGEDKKNLPVVIDAPNGLELTPNVKMRWDNQYELFTKAPDKIVLTWE